MSRKSVISPDDRVKFGQRLRARRLAAGLSQAQLAGKRFSHAYVSTIEAGRRGASKAAIDYFAQRLGIASEELWGEAGASWAMQMAHDLREEGLHRESRQLLTRTLENLQSDQELRPEVLITLHLELGWHDLPVDASAAETHLRRSLELAGEDESLLSERAEANAGLAELLEKRGDDEAFDRYKTSTALLLELLGRSPRYTRLERLRLRKSAKPGRAG